MGHTLLKKKKPPASFLYQVVYSSHYVSAAVLLLLLSFVIQPIARVYADDTHVETTISEIEDVVPDTPWEDVVELSAMVNGATSEHVMSDPEEYLFAAEDDTFVPEDIFDNKVLDGLEREVLVSDNSNKLLAGNDMMVVDQSTETSEPTFTVNYDSASFQFGRDACVQVADGSFYCQKPTTKNVLHERSDGLYALPDSDGDLEIYLQRNGELTQLTFNTVDDASPHFDQISNTIVWHRLIQDRYQIVEYDVDTATERQITSGAINNMEPVRAGKYTAWQYWGTAWDIVLYDGEKIKRLTETDTHDVAPSIRNGLVVWQRVHVNGDRTIELYDIKTGEYHSISDTEGGTISNPRMVVVYESTNEAGDVVTRGYDIITGEVTTLATLPVSLPERIPKPNETGEVIALVHVKSSTKDEQEEQDLDIKIGPTSTTTATTTPFDLVIAESNSVSGQNTSPQLSTTSSQQSLTLDLSPATNGVEEDVLLDYADDLTLVIPPFEVTLSSGSGR